MWFAETLTANILSWRLGWFLFNHDRRQSVKDVDGSTSEWVVSSWVSPGAGVSCTFTAGRRPRIH